MHGHLVSLEPIICDSIKFRCHIAITEYCHEMLLTKKGTGHSVFHTERMRGGAFPTSRKFALPSPPGKNSPADSPHQRLISPTK